ncbi:hypothetical protein Leryth_023305 [Lithospermum erythrorhizon]|nr:hypothetical protein Leryth_023305 [Lithospermum erythrorhizon]
MGRLKYSISTVLNFSISGAGGLFYPFSRDCANYSPRQELYQWESVAESARNALGMRYKLLPYLYTLTYEAHISGSPIARPLFFSFTNFTECYDVSTQFLLGSSLMVSPVLEQNKTEVKALFLPGTWYNMFDMTLAVVSSILETKHLPLMYHYMYSMSIYTKNAIIPMQRVALLGRGATDGKAKGKLFLDDDQLPEMKLGNGYSTYVEFFATVSQGKVKVWSDVQESKVALDQGWTIEKITVLGLGPIGGAFEIAVDGNPVSSHRGLPISCGLLEQERVDKKKNMMVEVSGLELPLGKFFAMSWKMGIKA